MRARVVRVFLNHQYKISYTYVEPKRFNDDVEAWSKGYLMPTMMEMWLMDGNEIIGDSPIITFATPEIVEVYTGLKDLFGKQNDPFCTYSFSCSPIEIEFVWTEREYPYFKLYHRGDYIISDKYEIPEIIKVINNIW